MALISDLLGDTEKAKQLYEELSRQDLKDKEILARSLGRLWTFHAEKRDYYVAKDYLQQYQALAKNPLFEDKDYNYRLSAIVHFHNKNYA